MISNTPALRSRFQAISRTLLVLLGFASFAVAPAAPAAYGSAPGKGQEISSDAQTWLRTAIHEGKFAELRWPEFSDYRAYLNNFYELNNYSLWWVGGQEPTPQARQIIELLLKADQKGLSPDDYDGPRWQDRVASLKPIAQHPSESDAVKFDLALSVCAMRYISDLHIGKVNPKRVAFFLDDASKKYDWRCSLKTTWRMHQTSLPFRRRWNRSIPATGGHSKPCKGTSSLPNKMMGSSFRP